MARFVRASVLRARGERPSAVTALRSRVRKAEANLAQSNATLDTVRASVAGVTNGTGRKIARLVGADA